MFVIIIFTMFSIHFDTNQCVINIHGVKVSNTATIGTQTDDAPPTLVENTSPIGEPTLVSSVGAKRARIIPQSYVTSWTSASQMTKLLYHWSFPNRTNDIKLEISPHSHNKGIFTAVIHNQYDNKVVVRNATHSCREETISHRKNAVTFHYVLSYNEIHTIEVTHLYVARSPFVCRIKLIPDVGNIPGWYICRE